MDKNKKMLKNNLETYGSGAKFFHWITVLLLVIMFPLGFIMAEMPLSMQKISAIGWHKSIGATILFLVLLRLTWRFTNPVPLLPEHMKFIERLLAHLSHVALYLFLLAMPISGWMMSSASGLPVSVFGWFTLPVIIAPDKELGKLLREAHELIAFAMLGMIGLHAGAALLHHFYYKDTILVRMLPHFRKRNMK